MTSSPATASPAATSAIVDAITTTVKSIASTAVNAITTPTTSSTSGSSSSPSSSSAASSSTMNHEGASTTEEYPSTTPTAKLLSVGDLSSSLQHFGWMDYFVFVLMLVVCAIIGFYFGFVEKKGKGKGREQRRGSEALDYLVGGRKMKVLPVSLSLVASFVSGISLLGTSTEIYVYGTQYAFIIITISLSAIISWYIFLPVFCNLQLTSTYEYFEMRFDKRIRLFGSALFTIGTTVWLPIVIYVPALAFNQVTGVNIHIITPVVCVVCIFYTMVGGLKAVVWTDVIQTFIMLGSIFLVIIKGTMDVGGFGVVWQRNMDSGRIELPEMTLDHTARFSMLSTVIGGTLYWTQVTAGNQVIVQRFLSVPGLKEAKTALIYFVVGVSLLLGCCAYNGLLIFATYHDCDPLSTKLAKAKDQLVPLLVMDILKVFPGLPGLFVSGVFSAALSSLSTGLNSLSAVVLEDFVKPNVKSPLTERQTAIILRLVVLLLGILCVGLVFVVEKLGMVLQLSMTLSSITSGPLFGLFIMGLTMPFINGKYFEMRFDRRIRLFGSAMFVVGVIVWLPIAVYVPALTFNQVSGINIHVITPVVCLVCTFYTCVGGLKAVVWTDVLQSFVMFGSIFLVIIKGTMDLGGFGVVWQRNADSGRLSAPEMSLDPTVRLSVLSVFIGGTLHKLQSSAVNQITIQRFISLPSTKKARHTLILFTIGLTLLLSCCAYVGLLTFATYHDCDPLSTKLAKATDQLVPLLVMHILGVFPGLPGLFVSGVFSAALSSLSTGLNSLACVVLEDFINPAVSKPLTERQTAFILRFTVAFFGLSCIGLVFVVEKLGMVLQLATTVGAVTQGPLLGIFFMGICMPWINGKYFERRFDRRIQLFGAILFIIESSLWLPIAVYVPALTFNQVTGIDIHIITPIVCAICTFYTCVGGIKAVVCADFIQGFVMFGSVFLVMIKGTMDVGGFGEVWQRNKDSGRVEIPEWTFDPTVRMSMLAVIVGGTIYKIQDVAISQPTVQRFISLPSMAKIKQTLIYSCFGLTLLLLSCVYVGMVTFATYHDCDPLTTKLAKARDQLVPLLVMDVLGKYPGLGGLFVSAVFSAALSSLSTVLNSLSAVILEDFAKPFSRHSLTENQTAIVMKSAVIFFGVMAVAMVYVIEKLGMVLQLSATLQSITKGPMLGIFIVGMCMPWVNSRSVLVGTGISFVTMGWICIRAQVALVRREIITPTKPVSVEGCTYDYVFTPPMNSSIYEQPLEAERGLHHVSWLWYGGIGAVLTVVCSNLAMIVFGVGKWEDVDVELVAPFLRKYYKPKKYQSVSKIDMADD